jgi:ubiquinone/menaquinone biosynthesis C-methylase UbiE
MKNVQSAYELQNAEQVISEHDDFTPDRYRHFFSLFPAKARRVLDIGCNTGTGGVVLKSLNSKLVITGLDCVERRLAALPAQYSNKIYGLSTDIPADDQSFDVVVGGEFLEHLYPGDVDRTLCEMQRVLAIGGRLLLTTPNPFYLKNRLSHKTIYGVSHLTQHFPKTLALRMMMHGFSNVRTCGTGRVSKYIGRHIPILSLYGSYLAYGDKY